MEGEGSPFFYHPVFVTIKMRRKERSSVPPLMTGRKKNKCLLLEAEGTESLTFRFPTATAAAAGSPGFLLLKR